MDQLLIFVPEASMDDPRLLIEAVDDLSGVISLMATQGVKLAPEGDEDFGAWHYLHSCLKVGKSAAFVQSRLARRWARIPRSHWSGDVSDSPAPPSVFTPDGQADKEFHGQPIVIDKPGLEAAMAVLVDLGNAKRALLAADSPAPPVSAATLIKGKRPGDEEYAKVDPPIVQRVIDLCDGKGGAEKILVSKALRAVVRQIAPVDADVPNDDSKMRRIRDKVQKRRPDLTDRNA